MTTHKRKKPPQEVKRFTLQSVVKDELMTNWKHRLTLACEHTVIVSSYKVGDTARCYQCGEKKDLLYDDELF